MESQLLETIVTGFPNLLFAAIALLLLWKMNQQQGDRYEQQLEMLDRRNTRLLELLVRAYEMCDDPAAPAMARARRTQEVASIVRDDD